MTSRSALSASAIGLLFVGMLALGVVIVSRSSTFSGDLVHILFGEILGIGPGVLLVQAAATLAVGGTAYAFARPFLLLCFDRDQAQVAGFSARRYHNAMLLLVAGTVIVSFQTVGTLLVFGMSSRRPARGAPGPPHRGHDGGSGPSSGPRRPTSGCSSATTSTPRAGAYGGPGGHIIFFVVLAAREPRARAATPDEAAPMSGETIVTPRPGGRLPGRRSSGGSTSRSGPDLQGLVGTNGSGKSTRLRTIVGLQPAVAESSPCSARQRAAHPVAWPT